MVRFIFDWDGVISNSFPTQLVWYRQICETFGKPFPYETTEDLRAIPQEDFVSVYAALGFDWEQDKDVIWKEYRAFATPGRVAAIPLHAGMSSITRWLRDWSVQRAIASANTRSRIMPSLRAQHLEEAFDTIVTYDDLIPVNGTIPSKPHPAALIHVLDHYKRADPRDCIYIGDQCIDIATTRNLAEYRGSAMPIISTSYGYTRREALVAMQPDLIVDSPQELVQTINGIVEKGTLKRYLAGRSVKNEAQAVY